MIKLFLFLVIFALFACEKNDKGYKDTALAYVELRIAEQEYGETEDGRAVRSQILRKHGLSAKTFEEKIEEIKKEDINWIKFQKNVMDILDSMEKELADEK
jgi:hypothetical protein